MFNFQNFVDMSFDLKDKDGKILNRIKVARVMDYCEETSIIDTEGNKFKYLLDTKKWHLVYIGLNNEECVKRGIGYTLRPVEIGCVHYSR